MQIVFPLVLLFVTSAVFGQNNEHAWKDADSWMIDDSEYFLPQGTCGRRPYDTSEVFNKNIRPVQNAPSRARSASLLDKIVGGSDATHGEIPWQASVKIKRNGDHQFRHHCGAIIISEYWLLTAAHCFFYENVLWRVTVGEHHLHIEDPGQQTFEVEIFTHEQYGNTSPIDVGWSIYEASGHDYDIALLKIKPGSDNAGIQFNDYVQPVCLPDSETYLQDGTKLLVSGWGRTLKEEHQLHSDVLQKAIVPLMNHEKCKQSYYPLQVTDNMFCAGYDEGGIDSCTGDSGGPVAIKTGDSYMLYGIVSWGYGCALPGKPGVYARVPAFLNWIDTTINSNSKTFGQSMLPGRSD